ncbi:MAG: molybdopterin-guanine dinucleotide biosynthesis protein A [Alphaproteobacteria bacterium]|jgi:hypothetical protein|nr:molybdopterin-guanine dinucleotide biosynthesis protein A [Alphaproteobacteria bacterium]
MIRIAIAAALGALVSLAGPASADDRHAGYYYPQPQSSEVYYPRATPLPEANRDRRLGFVTGITTAQLRAPYPPTHVLYAKGAESEKLVIVALQDGYIDTIYRARALLAAMTAQARATPIFTELEVESTYTFFDLAVLLGFKQITISDGQSFAHQVTFE